MGAMGNVERFVVYLDKKIVEGWGWEKYSVEIVSKVDLNKERKGK